MMEKIGKVELPRITAIRFHVGIDNLLRGLRCQSRHIYDLEPGRGAFARINIRMKPEGLFSEKINELTKEIFGANLREDVQRAAADRVKDVLESVGFSEQVDLSDHAKMLPALVDRWEEINAAMDFPDGVKRFPVMGLAETISHSTCRHKDDYTLIKVRFSALKEDVTSIGDEILLALKRTNEIILTWANDTARQKGLMEMFTSEGVGKSTAKSRAEDFFTKDGVRIRYAGGDESYRGIPLLGTMFIYQHLDVKRISESLKKRGFIVPPLGIIVEYCAEDHPSFIKYDHQKHLALVVVSERTRIGDEIQEGIFRNMIETNIELWSQGQNGAFERLPGVEDQLMRGDASNLATATIFKAVTPLHAKPKLIK